MDNIRTFQQLAAHLGEREGRRRVAVVCGTDASTRSAVQRAVTGGFAEALFVGHADEARRLMADAPCPERISYIDATDDDDAAQKAVALVREGEADVLMKGLVPTDTLLHAVLNKQTGLLPPGGVLTHLAAAELPAYDKLLLFTDAAVIPYPTPQQRETQVACAVRLCHALGVEEPRVALIHCSEHVSDKFPHTLDYRALADAARAGRFGRAIVDGPLDVRTSCDAAAMTLKGIDSPIAGRADALVFPDIEAGNAFYKTITLFAGAETAGVLQGTVCPVVLPSRGDSADSKFYSLALAALS